MATCQVWWYVLQRYLYRWEGAWKLNAVLLSFFFSLDSGKGELKHFVPGQCFLTGSQCISEEWRKHHNKNTISSAITAGVINRNGHCRVLVKAHFPPPLCMRKRSDQSCAIWPGRWSFPGWSCPAGGRGPTAPPEQYLREERTRGKTFSHKDYSDSARLK